MVFLLIIAHFACAVLLTWLANWLGLIPWQRASSEHWTERARLLWPARVTAALNVFLIPVLLYEAQSVFLPDTTNLWILNGLSSLLGSLLGSYPFDHAISPRLDFRKWRQQVVAGWGVRFGIWALLIVGMLLMPETVGLKMVVVIAIYLLLHSSIQWGLFLKYLQWVKFAKPAGERLRRIVDESSAAIGIAPKALWQFDGPQALAFAFPTTRDLVFSDRLLEICSDEEVSVVCTHELAHLSESKLVIVGRFLGSLSLFPLIFINPCVHYFNWIGLLIPVGGLFGIIRFARWLSLKMEKRADQTAISRQLNEGIYATALEKLYRENQVPAVNPNDHQTHPHLYDRMVAAGIIPDYPRPAKPSRMTWVGYLYLIGFGLLIGTVISRT